MEDGVFAGREEVADLDGLFFLYGMLGDGGRGEEVEGYRMALVV